MLQNPVFGWVLKYTYMYMGIAFISFHAWTEQLQKSPRIPDYKKNSIQTLDKYESGFIITLQLFTYISYK